jgi:hypothetical protein
MSTLGKIFHLQHYHLLGNIILLIISYSLIFQFSPISDKIQTTSLVAFLSHGLHVTYVWICWRTELHLKLLTRLLGRYAVPIYAFFFFIQLIGRPITVLQLAAGTSNTIQIPAMIQYTFIAVIALITIVTFHSIIFYFGFIRAAGADHFEEKYRKMGKVTQGIYKYFENVMYTFTTLCLFIPGLVFKSLPAIVCAAYHYTALWIHYFCTEKPDMEYIYGGKKD